MDVQSEEKKKAAAVSSPKAPSSRPAATISAAKASPAKTVSSSPSKSPAKAPTSSPASKATPLATKAAASSGSKAPAASPAKKVSSVGGAAGKAAGAASPSKKPGATAAKGKAAGGKSGTAAPSPAAAPPSSDVEPQPMVDDEEQARLKAEAMAQAEAEMTELRQKAWLAQVELDRKEEAKRRKKAEDEAKRRKEEIALTKALLEAAFDGEDAQLLRLLDKGVTLGKDMVDCCDAHGNTLLSEAAAGGSASTVKLLLDRHANPNSQGEFKRTPLWRAAFLGQAEVIQPLLEAGADPRIANESGEAPAHVATVPAIKEALSAWDVSATDALVARWEARQEQKLAAAAAERTQAIRSAQDEVEAAQAAHDQAQHTLRHTRMELEKRITEHDTCVEERKPEELLKVTLGQIHEAEAAVEAARKTIAAAAERLDTARLALREQQAAQQEEAGEATLVGVPVEIKALDEVLMRDVGDKIRSDGRWPLVIDPSGQSSVFLRYQDTNYVNALSSHNTEPNRLRRSILGGLRYGKPVVVDLMDVDLWPVLPGVFDAVQPGLLESLLDKSLLKDEAFKCLIRPDDGEEYDLNKFQAANVSSFKLVFLTSVRQPNEDLVQRTYALRIIIRG